MRPTRTRTRTRVVDCAPFSDVKASVGHGVGAPETGSDWRCAEKSAKVLGCEELGDGHRAGNRGEEAVCLRLIMTQRAEHVLHLR
jgi:hypothetical protein